MLKYKLVAENDSSVTYHYFPEGLEDRCVVIADKKTGSVIEETLAKVDEFKWYFNHMIDAIEEFIKNGEFRKEGMIAWY